MQEYTNKKFSKMKYFALVLLMFMVSIFTIVVYRIYDNWTSIDENIETNYETVRTSYEVKEEDEEDTNIIEDVTDTIVGISKIRETGDTIFLSDGATSMGLGTGIIISDNGYILTNSHVSGEKYSVCFVTLEDGRTYNANVVWSDTDIDLSIIKISATGLKYATLGNSDEVKLGDKVYAIGNPIGFEFQRTVTSGIISAVDRSIKIDEDDKSSYMEDLIQTDATINPGSSGGPLINTKGEVLGINTVKITSAESIGFAVPINTIKPIINKLSDNQNFETATLGIFAYDKKVLPYLDNSLKLENGIYVADVKSASAASDAGLMKKDVILKVDGKNLEKMSDLRKYVYSKNPGDNVSLHVKRGNVEIDLNVILGKK